MAPTPSKIAGATAADQLTRALRDHAALGERPHCSDPELSHLWLSESDQERAVAATLCPGCPVQLECWSAARAQDLTWGVWGSVDFTREPNRPRPDTEMPGCRTGD
jgi:Transcription factor WhiB